MGPELSAAETAEATATAIADRGKSLGLTWGLRLATVVDGSNPQAVLATYDGDDVPIGMVSMIGTPPAGARVYAIQVPPGGNFIIADTGAPAGPIGANTSNNGTLATSAGSEVAIPAATWDTEPTYVMPPGRLYRVVIAGETTTDSALVTAAIVRLREGSATTSGTELAQFDNIIPAGLASRGVAFTYVCYIKNSGTSTVSTKLSLTIDREAGAGNFSLFGDTVRKMSVAVEDIGTTARNTALASIAISV